MNYFELFELPVSFTVDRELLQQRYRSLQQRLHPDRFASASERDKLMALQKTSEVNDGFQTLKHPLSRAEHMLALRGITLAHEQQTIQDNAFLMTQMELREELEEIKDESSVAAMDTRLQGFVNELTSELAGLLERNTNESDQQAADVIRKLKFMYKLRAELERIEDRLFDA